MVALLSGNYEPYEYVTGYNDADENGNLLPPDTPTGFAVEMIVRTCDLCGLQCEWARSVPFNSHHRDSTHLADALTRLF